MGLMILNIFGNCFFKILICLGAKSKLSSALFESYFHLGVGDCFVPKT